MAPTALCKYAKTLSSLPEVDLEPPMHYPMYTAPLDVVLKMTSLQTHEELLELEILMQFTPAIGKESDRHAVGRIVKKILQLKLTESLRKGDLCAYRMVLNHQHSLFLDCDIDAITGFLPVRARSSLCIDEDAVADFLHQNGFIKVDSRDATGWSPLCYAVTQQSTELVKALLMKKAFPNDQITKANKKLSMAKGLSILTLCIVYNNNDSLRVLLEARAVPNPKDGFGCTPLYYAAFSNNAKGARLLCDFHADPNIKNKFGFDCVDAAFGFGAKEVAEVVWTTNHAEKPFLLHWAMIFCGGGPDLIAQIVERGFELNQQLQATNLVKKLWRPSNGVLWCIENAPKVFLLSMIGAVHV